MKRGVLLVAACVLAVLAAAAVRAVWAGGEALDDGDAAIRRGDPAAAIHHWRRAARWYVPVAGATGDALARLEKLGDAAEKRGDIATARAAWQAIHSATIAIRGATAPFDDVRTRADAHLAAALAAAPNPSAGATVEERTAYHARVLAGSARPTRGWLALALAGVILALAGAIHATLAYRRGDPEPRRARLRTGLLVFAAGTALWFAGMLLA